MKNRTQNIINERNEEGFALIALMGALAIVVIMATVIVPNMFTSLNTKANETDKAILQDIGKGATTYLRSTQTWPPSLAAQIGYSQLDWTQLLRNDRLFLHYYALHPNMSGFNNGAGLAEASLADARFLLISDRAANAAPTITNATEFNTWWTTDESATPDLHIYRENNASIFHKLTLKTLGLGGSYQINGTITNSAVCGQVPEHIRYHLPGTVVQLDEAGTYTAPEIQFALTTDVTYTYDVCRSGGSKWYAGSSGPSTCDEVSLWLTTNNNVSGSGVPCMDSWADGEIIQLGVPNLAFEPGTTSGTFSSAVNMEGFAQDGDIGTLAAIHYVGSNITVGTTTSIDLLAGDLLFAHHVTSETFINLPINTDNWQLLMFRPDTPGNYSAGTVSLLLFEPTGGHVHSVSLVEADTVVGDTTLQAGTFLLSKSGPGKNDILHFSPTHVGGTTTGTLSTLLDCKRIGIAKNNEVQGLDLIETTTTIGDTTLTPGTILVTLKNDDAGIGSNGLSTKKQDIFYLDVTSTEIGSGDSVATATLLLEGADVNLDTPAEDIRGLSVAPTL